MQMQSFEIRVALLGYVSAGKSTVLNALLQNKCSEVAMRRTTAGVNLFRVYSKGASSNTTEASNKASWNPDPEVVHTPPQVLSQITSDNKELRLVNSVQETTFNVELDDPICDMRQDTTLVLMDIPGLNEAGSNDIYFEYVMEKWDTLDCVVVVMDVFQGVNTEEQVKLLEIIHQNKAIKDIPVIVLCNKVDDPDNKEVRGLVEEISQKVHSIFDESSTVHFVPISAENAFVYRTASRLSLADFKLLDESLVDKIVHEEFGKAKWRKLSVEERYETAYNAISNASSLEESLKATNFHAFLHSIRRYVGEPMQPALIQKQLVVKLKSITFDDEVADKLKKLHDMEEWLGVPPLNPSEHFWNIYDKFHVKYIDTFVTDMDHRCLQAVMLQLIAFGRFLQSLGRADCAEMARVVDAMSSLVSRQVRWIVEQSGKSTWLTRSVVATKPLYDWNETTCRWEDVTSHQSVNDAFRNARMCQESAHNPPLNIPPANNPHHWKRTPEGWKNIYTNVVIEGEHNPVTGKLSWASISSFDFCTMARSILLLSYSKSFNMYFGQERFLLETVASDFSPSNTSEKLDTELKIENSATRYHAVHSAGHTRKQSRPYILLTEMLKCEYNDKGELVPKHPDKYSLVAQIGQPKLLSDPNHWGHLAWQFCEFVDGLSEVPKG